MRRACLDPSFRWRCAVCLRTANNARALEQFPCLTRGRATPAAIHRLTQCGPYIYCRRCGAYSGVRTKLLKKDCVLPEHPTTVRNHVRVIESLGNRRHPRSGVLVATQLQGPKPIHLIDEWRLLQDHEATLSASGPPDRNEAVHQGCAHLAQTADEDESPFGLPSIDEFMPEQASHPQPDFGPTAVPPPSLPPWTPDQLRRASVRKQFILSSEAAILDDLARL